MLKCGCSLNQLLYLLHNWTVSKSVLVDQYMNMEGLAPPIMHSEDARAGTLQAVSSIWKC